MSFYSLKNKYLFNTQEKTTNFTYVHKSEKVIRGNNNIIKGDNNVIYGNRNIVYGNSNSIIGDDNTAYGKNNRINGKYNSVKNTIFDLLKKNTRRKEIIPKKIPKYYNKPYVIEKEVIKIKEVIKEIPSKNNDKICPVCYEEDKCILYRPCNHVASCKKCYVNIKTITNKCPICRTFIEDYIKIYL
jgi:hypothetical protein